MKSDGVDRINVVPLRPQVVHDESAKVLGDVDVRTLLPAGEAVTDAVPFASDVWRLRGHPSWKTKAGTQTNLDFRDIPARWRAATKEWALLCLNPPLALVWAPADPFATTWPRAQEPLVPVTVQGNLKTLRAGLSLLDRYDLPEPDEEGWERVQGLMSQPQDRTEKLAGTELSPGTLRARAYQLRSFWSVRTIVERPSLLGSVPFGDIPTSVLFERKTPRRRNLRRPHEDVGLCLGFVAWCFDHVAEEIVEHARWWATNSTAPENKPGSRTAGCEAMTGLFDEIVSKHHVLPATPAKHNGNPAIAYSALAGLLGELDSDEAYLWGRTARRSFVDVPLDLAGGNPCPLSVSSLPLASGDGVGQWTPRLLNTNQELQWWASALVYYAMFYIAATCGLRDLDLDCLPLDCAKSDIRHRPSGEPYEVTTMRGYKQKGRIAPVPTEWRVNARIRRIIGVVQSLHEIYGIQGSIHPQTGERRLFDSRLITASKRSNRESVHLDLNFMDWIVKGARRLFDAGVTVRHLDDVTRLNVGTVRIATLQAYASRPLGNALAAQFGQWSGQAVALGYHSDIFKLVHLADPSDAEGVEHENIGLTLVRAAQKADELRGNGAARVRELIERHGAGLANAAPLSAARLRALGKRNQNLRTGPSTLCLYNPTVALCGGEGAADFRLCRPFECGNSAMTVAQRARVELRRRQELQMAPILHRSAKKTADAMPEVVAEFSDSSDEELGRIVAEDLDDYMREALDDERGRP